MAQITEVAPDLYRISTYVPEANLQFNQFLILDNEPLLYHTGINRLFPMIRNAVASLIVPAKIRWIGLTISKPTSISLVQVADVIMS